MHSSTTPRLRNVSPRTRRITDTLTASHGKARQNFTSTVGSSVRVTGARPPQRPPLLPVNLVIL